MKAYKLFVRGIHMIKYFFIISIVVAFWVIGYRRRNQNVSEKDNKIPLFNNDIKEMLHIVVDISTVMSVLLVLLTLREMRIERDNSYRPELVFETVSMDVHLGSVDDKHYIKSNTSQFNTGDVALSFLNIGVGVAKNVSISIDICSYNEMGEFLDSFANGNLYSYSMNEVNYVRTDNTDGTHRMLQYEKFKKVYILPNAEETVKFLLPSDLLDMIVEYKVQQHNLMNEKRQETEGEFSIKKTDIPKLQLNVEFQDVQGKKYMQKIYLYFENSAFRENKNGDIETTIKISMFEE